MELYFVFRQHKKTNKTHDTKKRKEHKVSVKEYIKYITVGLSHQRFNSIIESVHTSEVK